MKFWLRVYGMHQITGVSFQMGEGRGLGRFVSHSWSYDGGKMVSGKISIWPHYAYSTRRRMG